MTLCLKKRKRKRKKTHRKDVHSKHPKADRIVQRGKAASDRKEGIPEVTSLLLKTHDGSLRCGLIGGVLASCAGGPVSDLQHYIYLIYL